MTSASDRPDYLDELERQRRQAARRERKAAGARSMGVGTRTPTPYGSQLYVVPTADLADVISPIMDAMDHDRRSSGPGRAHIGYINARRWLASELGCDPNIVARITARQYRYTGLALADDIVVIMGIPEVLHYVIPVYAHPRISRRVWIERATAAGVEDPTLEWLLHAPPEAWERTTGIIYLTNPRRPHRLDVAWQADA